MTDVPPEKRTVSESLAETASSPLWVCGAQAGEARASAKLLSHFRYERRGFGSSQDTDQPSKPAASKTKARGKCV